jgi:hypothetical protein
MPFVAIPNCWKLELIGQYSSNTRKTATILHVYDTNTHNSARATAIATAVVGTWFATDKTAFHGGWALSEVIVTDLAISTGVQVVYTTGLPISGTGSGAPAGAQACPVTTLYTALRGRSYRGRVFWPGLRDVLVDSASGSSLTASGQSGFDAVTADLQTAITGVGSGSISLGVASNLLATVTPVTGWKTRAYLGTQRRRVKP